MKDASTITSFFKTENKVAIYLYQYFLDQFATIGTITIEPTKTMIGFSNGKKKILYITRVGKNFIHVVFPFRQPYNDNFCFQKIAQVPGDHQFNHHFRMLDAEDITDEVLFFMQLAYNGE